jgi:predicted MFS family arabinose efflux permease
VFSVRFLGFSIGEVLAYSMGGTIVDAYGVRFTYLLAGAATATAGLFVLFFLIVASTKNVQDR